MTVLYFTATGNCLCAAKRLGGTKISIPQAMREGQLSFEDDAVGLVFPVYGLCVPPLVAEFLEKAEIKTRYLFGVLTYGFYAGGAADHLRELTAARGLTLSYVNTWRTVENYIPGFEMTKEIEKAPADASDALDAIVRDVQARKTACKKVPGIHRFMTWTHKKNFAYPIGVGVTEQYWVAENCGGCGTCAQVCPMDNIRIEQGRPVFSHRCVSCLACVQNCPGGALHMKGEKSGARYRHPEVSLKELVEANR